VSLWVAGVGLALATVALAQESATNGAAEASVAAAPAVHGAAAAGQTVLQLLLKGGPVMYPLGLCSIVMMAFAIERALGLRRSRIIPDSTVQCIRRAIATSPGGVDPEPLARELTSRPDALARVAVAGLRCGHRPLAEIEKAMEDTGAKEVAKMQRNNRVLSAIAGVAPLLGLLGTVTGIIRTFMVVAAHEEALGRTKVLAGGIYEALVSTAVGMMIAIVSLLLYTFYQERVDRLATEIDDTLTELVNKLAVKA